MNIDTARRVKISPLTAIDIVSLLTTMLTFVFVATDVDFFARPGIVLAFVLFVPGWTIARLAHLPLTSLTIIVAFSLSVVVTIITSFVLVLVLDWIWKPVALAQTYLFAVLLAYVLRSSRAPSPTIA